MSAFLDTLPVYTGVWTNWDRGAVLGATITLSQRSGAGMLQRFSNSDDHISTRRTSDSS